MHRAADTACDKTVAHAAPATSILQGTMNTISKTTFSSDEKTRKYSGVLESPSARSILEIIL